VAHAQFRNYRRRIKGQMEASLAATQQESFAKVLEKDSVPQHTKDQVARLAKADDEIAALRAENEHLRHVVVKAKLWFEMRLLRQRTEHEASVAELTNEIEARGAAYWRDARNAFAERDARQRELHDALGALASSEVQVDQLRREMQTQLGARRDLTTLHTQQSLVVADLAARFGRLEAAAHGARTPPPTASTPGPRMTPGLGGARAPVGSDAELLRTQLQQTQQQMGALRRELQLERTSHGSTDRSPARAEESQPARVAGAAADPAWRRRYAEAAAQIEALQRELQAVKGTTATARPT
jgi:hypothetical protein